MAKPAPHMKSSAAQPIEDQSNKLSSPGTTPLNFEVPLDFRHEFKIYAAKHNMKLNQLLYEAFAALKSQND